MRHVHLAKINFRTMRAVAVLSISFGTAAMACSSGETSKFTGSGTKAYELTGGTSGTDTGSLSSSGSTNASSVPVLTELSDGGTATTSGGDPRCASGGNTTISGIVYDPATADPLYNVTVFIPDTTSPLPALARSGASCGSCSALYPASVNAVANTDAHGRFTLSMSAGGQPLRAGQNVPIVVQTGKWRMQYTIGNVATCVDNPQPDKSLHLPRNSAEGDLPDIAISTGLADSLECLPLRIGVDASEYTPGASTAGHIHIFQGRGGASTAPPAPAAYQALWDSTADLQRNDVVLLSCEGKPTSNMTTANQQSLSDYASAGGRVFASHFHYAWLNTGPFAADDLATWSTGSDPINDRMSFLGNVVTTLNVGGGTFQEGAALDTWLGGVGALTNGKLPIWFARGNAVVSATNAASQPWIKFDDTVPAPGTNGTQYFSFDTPVASTSKCGRVVYSDLHVSGGAGANEPGIAADYTSSFSFVTPTGCAMHPLTPQEKALEFMLFDLSSCLQQVGMPPQVTVPTATVPR